MSELSRHLAPGRWRRRVRAVGAVGAAASLLLATPGAAAAQPAPAEPDAAVTASVDAAVTAELAEDGRSDFWVVFEERADLSGAYEFDNWARRGQYVYGRLTATAKASQAALVADLSARGVSYEPFWIANAVLVRGGDGAALQAARSRPGVAEIRADEVVELPDPIEADDESELAAAVDAVEWGVADIGADQVWADFGIRGEGVVVGNIDTGVEYTHPALVEQYRGNHGDGTFDHNYNWWDPAQICGSPSLAPCDNHGHGSHTMGTMVGEGASGGDNQIGVAPGARWIAAKGCETNNCSAAALLSAGQFMLAPTDLAGQNPRPELRPHVVNNSWGDAGGNPWYDQTVAAWAAAGIFPVFANGNSGPACDTAGSPADGPDAYGVGAYDVNHAIAVFSSRGPGRDEEIRPDIAAPGVDVRSSVPGGYANFNGTSMAAPHVAGAVALILSAAPSMVGDLAGIRDLLDQTAVDTEDLQCGGTPGDNNVFGQGRLDAHVAVGAAPRGPIGSLAGTVTDAATGDPIAGARVEFMTGAISRTARTGPDGGYAFPVVPVGSYDVTTTAFGYATVTAPAALVEGQETVLDFPLAPVPSHPVTGTVTDEGGDTVEAASVIVNGTPIPPATTRADGGYRFDAVPEGSYSVTVAGGGCLGAEVRELTVAGPQTLDVTVSQRRDQYGYGCRLEPSGWVEATDPLPTFPPRKDTFSAAFPVPVELPFAFPFYGTFYTDPLWVASTGYVSFSDPVGRNEPGGPIPAPLLPDPDLPNAAIYPFGTELQWDWGEDLPGQVLTATVGEPGDLRFVVEWRDVGTCPIPGHPACHPSDGRLDFQVVLHESGEILLQYRNIDPNSLNQRGAEAVVGIENADGTDALPYSMWQPVLSDAFAIRYIPPPIDGVVGIVRDATDRDPIDRVTVTASNGEQIRTTEAGGQGQYGIELPAGTWQLEFNRGRYQPQTRPVTVTGGLTQLDVALATATATVDTDEIDLSLTAGERATVDVALANSGSVDLGWWAATAAGRWSHEPAPPPADPGEVVAAWPFNEKTGSGPHDVVYAEGRVWVAYTLGDIGDIFALPFLREFTLDGRPTGRQLTLGELGGGFVANADDAVFVPSLSWLCTGGEKDTVPAVVCVDPDTGEVTGHFLQPPEPYQETAAEPESGIQHVGIGELDAYNPDQDIFYVRGAPEDHGIYQLAGFSHPEPGRLLSRCRVDAVPDSGAGLSYHRASHTLWQASGEDQDVEVLQLDPDTCAVLGELPNELPQDEDITGRTRAYFRQVSQGAGDSLWFAAQVSFTSAWPNVGNPGVFEVPSGAPEVGDVPWLAVDQPAGTLAPGATRQLEVTIDTTDLSTSPGVYTATLVVASNAGREPRLQIPIRVVLHPAGDEDVIPPAAWATLDGEREWGPTTADFVGGPDKSVQVTLAARDNYEGTGTDTVEYWLDGQDVAPSGQPLSWWRRCRWWCEPRHDWISYEEPFAVSEPGTHTVTFRATDQAGNTSEPESVSFTVAAGRLAADQDTLAVEALPGGVVERTVTVTNTGNRPASLSVLRRDPDPAPAPARRDPADPPEIPAEWTGLPSLPDRLSNPLTAVVGDFLYAFGGNDEPAPPRGATVYAFDLTTGQEWVRLRDMPVIIGEASPPPGVIDGRIYLATRDPDELWIYDPATDTWQTGAAPPQNTGRTGSAVVDGQLYLVGGFQTGQGPATWFRRYDPATDSWHELPDYPVGIVYPYCGGIDGKVYCAGGIARDSDRATTATHVFDPADEQAGWRRLADLPMPLSRGAVTAANGTLFLLGGLDREADYVYHGYAYHAATDSWSELPSTNTKHPPWFSTGACGPDGIYKIGGRHVTIREFVDVLPGSFDCEQSADTPVPWLSVDGPGEPIAPGASAEVTVRFDAGAVPEPGTYTAELALVDLTPYAAGTVEVSMVVDDPGCDRIITGIHAGRLRVTDGVTCVADGATVAGPVSVRKGAGLVVGAARIDGPIGARSAELVQLSGARITGPVTVSGTTGELRLAGNRITGPVAVLHNRTDPAPIVISGNVIFGPLTCLGNRPDPVDEGVPNRVFGPTTGECARM